MEIEDIIIGTLITYPAYYHEHNTSLFPELFYAADNKKIFEEIQRQHMAGLNPDILTLSEKLSPVLENAAYVLSEKSMKVNISGEIGKYIMILYEHWIERTMFVTALEYVKGVGDKVDVFKNLEYLKTQITVVENRLLENRIDDIGTVIEDTRKLIEKNEKLGDNIPGLRFSGIEQVDENVMGWEASDIILGAGRPKMGKSSFANNVHRQAVDLGFPLVSISGETPKEKALMRLVAILTDLETNEISNGSYKKDKAKEKQVEAAFAKIYDSKLWIMYETITLQKVVNLMIAFHLKYGVNCFMIDRLGLFEEVYSAPGGNDAAARTRVMATLRALVNKYSEMRLIIYSQVSGEVDKTKTKRPTARDVFGATGAIANATKVLGFYRPEKYKIKEWPNDSAGGDGESTKGKAEIIVLASNYSGEDSTIVGFNEKSQYFYQLNSNTNDDEDIPF